MKKRKNIMALAAAVCACVACGALFMGNTESDPVTEFKMSGASIRYKESEDDANNGIRFGVQANDTLWQKLSADTNAVAGTLIIPTDMLEGELKIDNENAVNAVTYGEETAEAENVKISAWKRTVNGDVQSIVYLTGIPKTSYNRSLTAIGYIDWDGDGTDVEYTTDFVSLSIADVALKTKTLAETTPEQKTELDAYINTYTVSFVDEWGKKTTQQVKYGETFTTPDIPAAREGYEFLGYVEQTGSNTYATETTDFDVADKTVKGNRGFKAKVNAVGPTYEKPALFGSSWVFGGGGNIEYIANGVKLRACYLFGDMSIENGSDFVVSAKFSKVDSMQSGFVLKAEEDHYLNIVYRESSNDIYLWGPGQWTSVTLNSGVSAFDESGNTEMTLVYKNKRYFVFFNGVLGCSFTYNHKAYNWEKGANESIGSGETLKLGLASPDTNTTFTDWYVSTDSKKIEKYVSNPFALNSWVYGNASVTDSGTSYEVSGAWTASNVSVAKGTSFAIKATFVTGLQAGFVVSSETGSYLMFVYRKSQNDIYLWKDNTDQNSKAMWSNVNVTGVDVFGENDDETSDFVLVYKDGTYYMFIDGVLVLEKAESFDGSYGTISECIGSGTNVTFGLASPAQKTTFSNVSYTTDATEIAKYFAE